MYKRVIGALCIAGAAIVFAIYAAPVWATVAAGCTTDTCEPKEYELPVPFCTYDPCIDDGSGDNVCQAEPITVSCADPLCNHGDCKVSEPKEYELPVPLCFYRPCNVNGGNENVCQAEPVLVSCTDPQCNDGECETKQKEGQQPETHNTASSGGGNTDSSAAPTITSRVLSLTKPVAVTISAADRNAPDYFLNGNVPLVVEQVFAQVFNKKITHPESVYWKMRARTNKPTVTKIRGAMQWHKLRNSTGVTR